MKDNVYGTRNKRGDWQPAKPIEYPKVFTWPIRPLEILKWIPGYIAPWNLFYALVAILMWFYVMPPLSAMQTFEIGWISYLFACNIALTILVYGCLHVRLYVLKSQDGNFKYNGKWPDTSSSWFLFNNQTIDNMIWTLTSGVAFWTAYQVITLWLFANGHIPYLSLESNPVYFVALFLVIPLFREIHFYLVHRLLHWPPLYRLAHKLHHNNTNPGPWSGLSMHPVEHLLYFSGVIVHWIVMSHPVHAMFHLAHAGLSPAQGHTGFYKVVLGDDLAVDTHSYMHYLHHKHFECNYADGAIPLDKWFGTFHDGTEEAQEAMNQRFYARQRG